MAQTGSEYTASGASTPGLEPMQQSQQQQQPTAGDVGGGVLERAASLVRDGGAQQAGGAMPAPLGGAAPAERRVSFVDEAEATSTVHLPLTAMSA